MGTMLPELVSTAVPVTVKEAASGPSGQLAEIVSVKVLISAVKGMVPVTGIAGPEAGVSVKV
jgi:hypothetical protein